MRRKKKFENICIHTNVKLQEEANDLFKLYKNRNEGIRQSIKAYLQLRDVALKSLFKKLSPAERHLISPAIWHMGFGQSRSDLTQASTEKLYNHFKVSKMHGTISISEGTLNKIKRFSELETYFLIDEIQREYEKNM